MDDTIGKLIEQIKNEAATMPKKKLTSLLKKLNREIDQHIHDASTISYNRGVDEGIAMVMSRLEDLVGSFRNPYAN